MAVLLGLQYISAALVDGQYVPVGNDSFYHARRILDAAVGERGFYQFDDLIHVPEGSWLTWPWAYDYLMSRALVIAVMVSPGADPLAVLAYLPLILLVLNTALFCLVVRETGLVTPYALLAIAAYTISPMTQALHGVGVIDHHAVELTFVLLTAWLGMRFFSAPADRGRAVWLALTLGIAPAFHNSLFVLQLPVLAAAVLCWLSNRPVDRAASRTFATTLLAATLIALLPSATFLDLQFSFTTHSWFHLYVAGASGVGLLLLGRLNSDTRGVLLLLAAATILGLPLAFQVLNGAGFMAGATVMLDEIVEVRSPFAMLAESGSLLSITRYYSGLILVAPLILLAALVLLTRRRTAREIFLLVMAVFGIGLALVQFRLHPFGVWALPVAGLWMVQQAERRRSWRQAIIVSATGLFLLIAYVPPFFNQLFVQLPAGLNETYAFSRPVYLALGAECRERPGIVLAEPDDGHPIRFHSDCAVIANNFLLTRQHGEKVLRVRELYDMSPQSLRGAEPALRYVLVRLHGLWRSTAEGREAVPAEAVLEASPRLVRALSAEELPEGFELLGQIPVNDGRGLAYLRLIRVTE